MRQSIAAGEDDDVGNDYNGDNDDDVFFLSFLSMPCARTAGFRISSWSLRSSCGYLPPLTPHALSSIPPWYPLTFGTDLSSCVIRLTVKWPGTDPRALLKPSSRTKVRHADSDPPRQVSRVEDTQKRHPPYHSCPNARPSTFPFLPASLYCFCPLPALCPSLGACLSFLSSIRIPARVSGLAAAMERNTPVC